MTKLILALLFILVPCLAFAGPFLVSDPNPVTEGVMNFKISMDGGPYVDSPPVTNAIRFDLGTVSVGAHTIKAQACNLWGCSADSTPFAFTRSSTTAPQNLKLSP